MCVGGGGLGEGRGGLVGRGRKEKVEEEEGEEAGSWRRRGEKVREKDLERENKDGNEKQDT